LSDQDPYAHILAEAGSTNMGTPAPCLRDAEEDTWTQHNHEAGLFETQLVKAITRKSQQALEHAYHIVDLGHHLHWSGVTPRSYKRNRSHLRCSGSWQTSPIRRESHNLEQAQLLRPPWKYPRARNTLYTMCLFTRDLLRIVLLKCVNLEYAAERETERERLSAITKVKRTHPQPLD
jgi:hypothetical protein